MPASLRFQFRGWHMFTFNFLYKWRGMVINAEILLQQNGYFNIFSPYADTVYNVCNIPVISTDIYQPSKT